MGVYMYDCVGFCIIIHNMYTMINDIIVMYKLVSNAAGYTIIYNLYV